MSRNEAVQCYLAGKYQSAYTAASSVVTQSKNDLQTVLQLSKSAKSSTPSQQQTIKGAECDYALAILEHSHIIVTMIHVLMKRAVVTKDEQWCQFTHFSQTNANNSKEPIKLTLVQCFQQLDDYFALVPELCHAQDCNSYPTQLEPTQYPFLFDATPSQLIQIAHYLQLIATISRLYHYTYLTRRLSRISSTLSALAAPTASPAPSLFLPQALLCPDQISIQNSANASVLEMLLSTSQVNTRILLTKCRIVLEDTKVNNPSTSSAPLPSSTIPSLASTTDSTVLPWEDIRNFNNIPTYSQQIHTTIQTLVGNIIRSLTAPIPMISKIICTASVLNTAMEYFISGQIGDGACADAATTNETASLQRYVLVHVLQMFSHYNYFSELTTMFLILFQTQQQNQQQSSSSDQLTVSSETLAALPGATSLTKHTLPLTPDPFSLNHNNLITSQVTQTTHGALSLAFILQPIAVIFTQLHHILHSYLPFFASGIEYNMSLNYVNNILLSQDLGVLLPYFGVPNSDQNDTTSFSALLEQISFITPNNKSYAQHTSTSSSAAAAAGTSTGLLQTKSIEQFVINTICLILKYVGLALGHYQQTNPSKDGSILFDINSTRTQWILSILLNVTSWSVVQRVKNTRTYDISFESGNAAIRDGINNAFVYNPSSLVSETDSLPELESRSESNLSTLSTTSVDTNQSETDGGEDNGTSTRDRTQSAAFPSAITTTQPPPPPSPYVSKTQQIPDRGLAIDLECDYLFHFTLSLTNMTVQSYINAQLTTIDSTNPYINNTLSLLSLCTPSSVGSLGGKVGQLMKSAIRPQILHKYEEKISADFLALNYSTSLLLPVSFVQVKKILRVTHESSLTVSADGGVGESDNTDIYNDKYTAILSLLQQSHSTITKASTANKSMSQSHTASVSQYILVSDFFPTSLQSALSASLTTHNTLVEWYNCYIYNTSSSSTSSLSSFPSPLFMEFKTIFSPSLYASILPSQLSLITTSTTSPTQGQISTSSLPLTSISSIATPQQSLLLLTYDILLCAYSAGLTHEVFLDQENILTSVYNIPYLTPAFKNLKQYSTHSETALLPTRSIDIMQFFTSYLFSVVIHVTQLTHQQTLVTATSKPQVQNSTTTSTLFVPRYMFTLLNLVSASISKILQQYTIANGILNYFILNSLSISTLHTLSTLTSMNPHFNTLVQLVISSSSGKQVSAFESHRNKKDKEYQIKYQPLSTSPYSLSYQLPDNDKIPSQNIISDEDIGALSSIYTTAMNPNTNLSMDSESVSKIITTPQWLYALLQHFHYNLVPADLRLCKEILLDEDGNRLPEEDHVQEKPEPVQAGPQQKSESDQESPFGQKSQQRPTPAPAQAAQTTPLDMLIKYNVISPYLDSLYGVLSSQAMLDENTPAEKEYVDTVHLHPRGSVEKQRTKYQQLNSTIQTLALLSYIAQLSPQLALFILRFCPTSATSTPAPTPVPTEQPPNTTTTNNINRPGIEIEVIDETPNSEQNKEEEKDSIPEPEPDFVPTYPLLSTLLFFATSLSTEMDSIDLLAMEETQKKEQFEKMENRELNDENDQFISVTSYQLLLTKHLTVDIFAQLTQDMVVKTLIAAHGIDLYSLLASPDEYMIQYIDWSKETGIPTATIPRTCLAESATKQMIHTNLLFTTLQLTPVSTYSQYINKNHNNNTDKATNSRLDVFGHMWQPDDMCLTTTPTTAPIRTTYTSRFAIHALYSVGILVASQTSMIAKADAESLLEHIAQALALSWRQFEYLSYFDRELIIATEQWYLRHKSVMAKLYPNVKNASGSTSSLTHVAVKQLKEARFPYTTLGSSILSLLITSTADIFRQAVESLMYLCVDIKVKQSAVKHKLFFILHAFCGCISAQNPVPSVAQWAQRQKELEGQQGIIDIRPHHPLVQFKCANPSSIDLFGLVHSPSQDQLSKQEQTKHIQLQIDPTNPSNVVTTNLVIGELSEQTIKLINTYLGEHLLRDTSIRLAVLQTLHHFALSKADINRDEEQSQTSEQIAALKAAASRGIKTAASGGRVSGSDPQQKDISELFGSAAEMMPIQLLTAPFVVDCLYQLKSAYQYAFVVGLPPEVRSLVDQNLLKSITTTSSNANSSATQNGSVSMLLAKYSNNLLLPIPISIMILQILKTYASLKLPNDTMLKRFKVQLIWCYNIPSLILDINSQSNVLLNEMKRRDTEHASPNPTKEDLKTAKTIYPQRFFYPRKDHASTTQSDSELSQSATSAAAPVMSTDQITNTAKMVQLWCSLSLSRITIHTNPHILREEHFHKIVPILFDAILSDETTHELTVYESLLAVTNLLSRRDEQEYNYCLEHDIVNKIVTTILIGDVSSSFNLDITTAAVELLCNLCGLGVLEAYLHKLLPTLDVVKQSTIKGDGVTTTTTITNNAVLLLRILVQFGTYDEEGEKNSYQRQSDGSIETTVTTTSLLRLKCGALGCIAMLCGASPYLAACVAATNITSQTEPENGQDSTKTTSNEIFAPVALMALLQAPTLSPEREQGRPDASNGVVLGYKDVRVRCRHALNFIQQVFPMLQSGKELSRESW